MGISRTRSCEWRKTIADSGLEALIPQAAPPLAAGQRDTDPRHRGRVDAAGRATNARLQPVLGPARRARLHRQQDHRPETSPRPRPRPAQPARRRAAARLTPATRSASPVTWTAPSGASVSTGAECTADNGPEYVASRSRAHLAGRPRACADPATLTESRRRRRTLPRHCVGGVFATSAVPHRSSPFCQLQAEADAWLTRCHHRRRDHGDYMRGRTQSKPSTTNTRRAPRTTATVPPCVTSPPPGKPEISSSGDRFFVEDPRLMFSLPSGGPINATRRAE